VRVVGRANVRFAAGARRWQVRKENVAALVYGEEMLIPVRILPV